MALKTDIQYISVPYVDGSTARRVQPRQPQKAAAVPTPKRRRAKRKVIYVDPLAVGGAAIVMVMLFMMLVGFARYSVCREQNRQMQDYLTSMQLENVQLQQNYDSNIDLDYIQDVAEAIGMVPAQDAQQVQISVQPPQEERVEMSLWESITTFLAGLFA